MVDSSGTIVVLIIYTAPFKEMIRPSTETQC